MDVQCSCTLYVSCLIGGSKNKKWKMKSVELTLGLWCRIHADASITKSFAKSCTFLSFKVFESWTRKNKSCTRNNRVAKEPERVAKSYTEKVADGLKNRKRVTKNLQKSRKELVKKPRKSRKGLLQKMAKETQKSCKITAKD